MQAIQILRSVLKERLSVVCCIVLLLLRTYWINWKNNCWPTLSYLPQPCIRPPFFCFIFPFPSLPYDPILSLFLFLFGPLLSLSLSLPFGPLPSLPYDPLLFLFLFLLTFFLLFPMTPFSSLPLPFNRLPSLPYDPLLSLSSFSFWPSSFSSL